MEQLVIIDSNKIYIYSEENHPIISAEDATTEDIIRILGHDINHVTFAWGEDFTIEKD